MGATIEKQKLQVFIIGWEGFEQKAASIAQAIVDHVDSVCVVYSNSSNQEFEGSGHWLLVDNDWFYGKKFSECQRHFYGDIHLQIQADAHSDNWPAVIRACRNAFLSQPTLGVWAPNVNYSPWLTEFVSLGQVKTGLHRVVQTDGVIWALNRRVDSILRCYSVSENNSGWGIEQVAICIAMRLRMLVLRDTSVTVQHPKSTRYDICVAKQDKARMTNQLSYTDKFSFRIIVYGSKWRELLAIDNRLPRFIRKCLSRSLVTATRFWLQILRLRAVLLTDKNFDGNTSEQ